jgi:hypothetical protein
LPRLIYQALAATPEADLREGLARIAEAQRQYNRWLMAGAVLLLGLLALEAVRLLA